MKMGEERDEEGGDGGCKGNLDEGRLMRKRKKDKT